MLVKIGYVFVFICFSTMFCISGYEYNDEFSYVPYEPPICPMLFRSLYMTIYIMYGVLLLYKFKVLGIAGIAVALLIHYMFLRSKKRRKRFAYWCIPTYGGWALIYMALYLFVNHGK